MSDRTDVVVVPDGHADLVRVPRTVVLSTLSANGRGRTSERARTPWSAARQDRWSLRWWSKNARMRRRASVADGSW